ncbi:unannotated protein [freshwater metagenome]|uniref:Unannotated protein n=1 Tax=freshwater metagenome TaxID=449393 RepID=A0A6J6CZF2_9ZZZZ|nr:DUF4190 domain-containing protein [Actinomycetota bacterium]
MSNTATAAKTNVLAIVSLVTSILGFSLVGIITGHIGLSQIKKTGEAGSGLAIAGLVIGYVSFVAVLLWLVIFGGALLAAAMNGALDGQLSVS